MSLQHTFIQLLQGQGAKAEEAEQAWQELSSLYSESDRFYHTLKHIENMFSQMKEHVPDSLQSVELQLSIWYHDLIYDPTSTDNELNSAKIAKQALEKITDFSSESIERIYTNIMSTKGHKVLAEGALQRENQVMLDLDLSILGTNWERYMKYSEDIRQEYIMVPLANYKVGRSMVLKNFLEREEIYFSEIFKNLYEGKARENLKKEIEVLEK